jgi:transcription antitermination protein NusB
VNSPKPFSRRTLARMLACDILYQMDLTGEGLEKVLHDFDRMLKDGIDEAPVPPESIPDISLEHIRFLLGSSTMVEELVDFASESLAYPDSIPEFSRELVELYISDRERIDRLIGSYADHWSLERMPIVDRNLLRLGFAELLHRSDIPDNVTINEYLELAKAFSTEDSGKFINGILGKLVRDSGLLQAGGGGGPEGE